MKADWKDNDEALLHDHFQAGAGAVAASSGGGYGGLLTLLGFAFLTFNEAMAIYRSNGGMGAASFIVVSYIDLVLLFGCSRWYQRAEPGSATRTNLKVAIWLLTVTMGVPVLCGFFYFFFLHMRKTKDEPLLHDHFQAGAGAVAATFGGGYGGLLTLLGFAFLTFNAAMAKYRSNGGMGAAFFIVVLYIDLVLLFCCSRWYQIAEPGSATRTNLKVAIWLLTVTMGVPVLCGFFFYIFFLHMRRTKRGLLSVLGGIAIPEIRLIADTGASMHAVGDRSLLRGLRFYTVPRLVTLPNGTNLRILGIGNIELEHFRIPNVSLVEGFQKCLISMSQLDTDHGMHSCFGRGIGRIMLTDGTEVGGAVLDNEDNMYVLRFLNVPGSAQE